MRSNKEQNITTTTYVHNSCRGRPVSKVHESSSYSNSDVGGSVCKSESEQSNEVSSINFDQPINLSVTFLNNNIVKNYQVEFSCGSAVTVYLHGITNLFYCNVHEGVNKGSDKTINKTSRSVGDIPDTQTKGLLLKIRVKINRT